MLALAEKGESHSDTGTRKKEKVNSHRWGCASEKGGLEWDLNVSFSGDTGLMRKLRS